jgi:hypothetical protein
MFVIPGWPSPTPPVPSSPLAAAAPFSDPSRFSGVSCEFVGDDPLTNDRAPNLSDVRGRRAWLCLARCARSPTLFSRLIISTFEECLATFTSSVHRPRTFDLGWGSGWPRTTQGSAAFRRYTIRWARCLTMSPSPIVSESDGVSMRPSDVCAIDRGADQEARNRWEPSRETGPFELMFGQPFLVE